MKDNSRKCAKCNASTAQDSKLVLHRFPKPGPSNTQRMVAWAKFCYPEKNWNSDEFQRKLYTSHKMLCSKHFAKRLFIQDHLHMEKLHRYAIPSESTTTNTSLAEMLSEHQVHYETSQQSETLTASNLQIDMYETQAPSSQAETPYIHIAHSRTSNTSDAKSPNQFKKERFLLNRCRNNLLKICNLQNKIRQLKKQYFGSNF